MNISSIWRLKLYLSLLFCNFDNQTIENQNMQTSTAQKLLT